MGLFNKKYKAETPVQEVLDTSTHVEAIKIHTNMGDIDATLTTSTEVHSNYIRVDNRVNKYYSKDNTYLSNEGKKCINYETTLLNRVDDYNNSLCPYCKQVVKLPKQKVSCKRCGKKIYVVDGYIKQGYMILTEDEYQYIKILRDKFYMTRR